MPTTRPSLIFAICPTAVPTAPAAPDTRTVSPARIRPTSSSPKYAVSPVIPSTPRYAASDTPSTGETLWTPAPSESVYSRTPKVPWTMSFSPNSGWREVITRPRPIARITSPISTGAM